MHEYWFMSGIANPKRTRRPQGVPRFSRLSGKLRAPPAGTRYGFSDAKRGVNPMRTLSKFAAPAVAILAVSGQASAQSMTPGMKRVIDALKATRPAPVPQLTYDQAREQAGPADAYMAVLAMEGKPSTDPDVKAMHVAMPGPSGKPLILKLFRPKQAGAAKLPTVVYYHGGGWVIAGTRGYQASCEAIAKLGNCNVVEVAYRMAPEAKFPAAHEDSYAALQYVAKNPAKFMAVPGKISVLGESAGGNLATAVCMMAKDRRGFMPKAQVLIYPVTQEGMVTPSYRKYQKAVPLSTPMLSWFYNYEFGNPKGLPGNKLASPLNAPLSALRGLPPATFVHAEIDPLLSEGKMYHDKLKKAGVTTAGKTWMGVTHEFFGMGMVVPEAMEAEQYAVAALKKSWGM
ncbi:alpha/beta hydrolase [bacterium]|nr:MAG: alpha/beta hydrolase [bacterium]